MTTEFPILAQFPTPVAGVFTMPRTGSVLSSGTYWGWAHHDIPADKLVDYWCGKAGEHGCVEDNQHCKRVALQLKALPPGARVLMFDGFFGEIKEGDPRASDPAYVKAHKKATKETLLRYQAHADAIGAPIRGHVIDNEREYAGKAAHMADLFYGSGIFNRKETWVACWNVWNGKGTAYNEWGPQVKTHGLIDGQTATVHGYLRDPSIPGLFTTGVPWSVQVNRVLDAAAKAIEDYRIVPLTSTVLRDHANKPYPKEAMLHVRRMFRELAAMNPRAWWLFNCSGQQEPPFGQQGQYAYGVLKEKLTANPTMTAQAMLAELGDIVYNQHYAGEWEAIQIDTAATVAAIRGA